MGTRRLEVVITGDPRSLSRAFGQVSRDAGRMESRIGRVGRGLAVFGARALAAGAALGAGGLATGVAFGTRELIAQEKASARTANVLETTGGVANVTAREVEALAAAIQSQTGSADDAIQSSANLLLTFTNVRNEAGRANDIFSQAVPLINDMSVALGTDLNSATLQVGKALNDPIKGVTALSRAGVSFTQQQKDQIRAMQESGNILGAQKLILAELRTEFEGAARSEGQTTEALQQLQRGFEDMAEGLAARVLPAVVAVVEGFRRHWPQIQAVTQRVFAAVRAAVQSAMQWIEANVLPTIRSLVAGARALWARFGGDVRNAFHAVRAVVGPAMRAVAAIIEGVLAVIRGDWAKAWSSLRTAVSSGLSAVRALLTGFPRVVLGFAVSVGKAIVAGIAQGVRNFASQIWAALKAAIDSAFSQAVGYVRSKVGGLVTGIGGAVADLFDRGPGPGLRSAPAGSPLDLSRVRSAGDRAARSARLSAEGSARAAGANPDAARAAGERAYIAARLATIKSLLAKVTTRRRRLLARLGQKMRARAKVKVPRSGPGRQRALDARAALTQAIGDIQDELETLFHDDADLRVEAAELGADLGTLDRGDEAAAGGGPSDGGPSERDFLEAAAAEASLTPGTADDVAAAGGLVGLAQRELDAARASGDPRRVTTAIEALRQAQASLDALQRNTEALDRNTEAVRGFGGSSVFGYRGQDFVLRSLAPPSSDRLVDATI